MNRLFTLILMGLAGLLVSCGSSVSSSTQPAINDVYSLFVTPTQFTLNAGDWSSISAMVELSYENGAPKAVSPQPTIQFYSSDARVSVSPAGEVCAGQWDPEYLVCSPTVDLPSGYVTITAYDASHNVSGTTLVSVHPRVSNITLSAPLYTGAVSVSMVNGQPVSSIQVGQYPTATNCISQNNFASVNGSLVSNTQVQYVATPVSGSTPINPSSCTPSNTASCVVFPTDYVWASDNPSVAAVSSTGFVSAHTPGVANITATLNGTKSAPLAFVTCPPSAIRVATSTDTNRGLPPVSTSYTYSTGDLTVNKGVQTYLSATMLDLNGNPLTTSPLTYITSDPLTGSFTTAQPLTSTLTANTAGRFSMMAACEPPSCNNAVSDFVTPVGPTTGKSLGFGYPIYSNVIGVTVGGMTGSTVLVSGLTYADGVTAAHLLLAYDSEAMTVSQQVGLQNTPNSLVVAPNGATAYLGSSAGLMVVNLSTYQASSQNYPIVGGQSTDVVTGTVLGVSPDSRFVVVSDVPNGYVFLIDTTGTKTATRYSIAGINAVTFAADDSNYWIAGSGGVYTFNSDTFVPTLTNVSSGVVALAWMPDGQSYFASGNNQLVNYSTCDDQFLVPPNAAAVNIVNSTSSPINLDTTAINGVPHAVGLSGSVWYNYSVTTSAQVGVQTGFTQLSALNAINPGAKSDVCLSTVTVNAPLTAPSTLQSTASQITFSPTLEQEFVTGVNSTGATAEALVHGYDVAGNAEVTLATLTGTQIVPLSGGVLNDGRKLYVGTNDATNGPLLHRFDLSARVEDTAPASVVSVSGLAVIPNFVAVVPK